MKKLLVRLLAIIGILAVLSPYSVFAAYGLTQSADLEEDSATQFFSRADNALLEGGSALTGECWIKMENVVGGGADAYVIMSDGTGTGGQRGFVWKITDDGAGNIAIVTQTSSTGGSFDGSASVSWSPAPSNDSWYQIAWTKSGATEKFYVDATQMGGDQTSSVSTIFDNTGSFGIGVENVSGTPGDFFDGRISFCRFWQTARSQAQISADKCNVLGSTASLSGEWTLDNVLTDNSGNSLTLTNNGSIGFGADVPATCSAGGGGTSPGQTLFQIIES